MAKKEKIRFNKINAPYNFVPLNEKVVIPEWGKQISHDLPFSDGEDGCIEVTVSNLTPIITCDGELGKNAKGMDVRLPARIGDRYYLPGSGLKGMLRNVLEIMAFGKMQQYDDDFFGYRDFTGKDSATADYPSKMLDKDIHSGWLRLEVDKDGAERYLISECYYRKIEIKELENYITDVVAFEKLDAFKKCEFIEKICGKEYKALRIIKNSDGDINGKLVCSGAMNGKLHEYCLFGDTGKELQLSEKVADKFITVYKPSKCYGEEIVKRLRAGKKIPVFFRKDDAGEVESLGITRCYRYPFKYRVSELIGKEHDEKRGELDMAECIFGCVNQNGHESALRGRVQVGNALMSRPLTDSDLGNVISGVLGQPLASYYPLYLDQRKAGKYSTYNTAGARIAGRKRYRVHTDEGSYLDELPQGNNNEKTMSHFRPLKAGQQFSFKIRVHNLRPVEIGALLSALTFHQSATAHHNFGLAKSFGYGKLKIEKLELKGFAKAEMEYLKTFEAYMNGFVPKWCNSEQITQLIRIASDHKKDSDIQMMNLDEYKEFKKVVSRLKEGGETCKPLADTEFLEKCYAQQLDECRRLLEQNLFDEAKSVLLRYETAVMKLKPELWDEIKHKVSEFVQKQKDEIKTLITEHQFGEAQTMLDECRQKYQSVVGWADLQGELHNTFYKSVYDKIKELCVEKKKEEAQKLLDESRNRYPEAGPWMILQIIIDGIPDELQRGGHISLLEEKNLKGEYKVSDFKSLKNKIDSYKKVIGDLKSEDFDAVEKTVERILGNPANIKKEKKSWQSFDKGNAWRYLNELLGEERAKELFDKLMK